MWYKDGIELNITTSYYSAVSDGHYFVVVSESGCLSGSEGIDVEEGTGTITTPLVESLNGSYVICEEGGEVILRLSNYNVYTNASYAWFKNGILLPNSNSILYRATEAGHYSVMVTESGCTAVSESKNVTRPGTSGSITKPVVSKFPEDGRYCTGGSVYLSVQNTSSYTNPSYMWYKDGIELNITTPYYTATQNGIYFVTVKEGGCISGSEYIDILQGTGSITAPLLSMHPSGGQLCTGGNVYLTVSNSSSYTNATYNWYKNGVQILSNSSEFAYIAAEIGTYKVQVISDGCTALSEEKEIIPGGMISAPQITVYPESFNICGEHGVVVMRLTNAVAYSGATYQWYKDHVAIPHADGIMYSAVEPGNYYLLITTSDGCGVISQPVNVTKQGGDIAEVILDVFPVDGRIVGTNPVEMEVLNTTDYVGATYYWFKGTDIVASGQGEARYDALNVGTYRVLIVVSNSCAVWSREVNVTTSGPCGINDPVVNVIPPSSTGNYELCLPEGTVLFQIANLADYDAPAIQWYKNNNPIAGAIHSTLEVTETQLLGAGAYRVSITDQGCTVHSFNHNVVTAPGAMTHKPQISSLPQSNHLCGTVNGTVVLRFTNADEFTGHYQWYKNNYAIPGATDIIYEATETGKYRMVVIEGTCAALSDEITITSGNGIIRKPLLAKTPDRNDICQNGSIKLTVSNAGLFSSPVFYWYKGSDIVQQGTTPFYYAIAGGTYFVQVIDASGCSSVSAKEILNMSGTVIAEPAVTSYPSNSIICGDNGVVVLQLTTDYDAGTAYQWYRNNELIPGAVGKVYSAELPGHYHVEILSSGCAAYSVPVNVVKQSGNSISLPLVSKDPEELVDDVPVILTFTNPGSYTNPEYFWFGDDKGTLLQSNILNYNVLSEGNYHLLVTDNGCARWSEGIMVREAGCVAIKPLLSVIPSPEKTVCGANGSVLLQVSNKSAYSNPVYQWYSGSQPVGTNAPTLEVNQAGQYRVKVTDGNCYNYSSIENIRYTESQIQKPLVERLPAAGHICGSEGSVILRFTNSNSFNSPSYQWYKDNYAVTGATGLIYEVTDPGKYRIVVREGGCMAMSVEEEINRVAGDIEKPQIVKSPNRDEICINGAIRLTIDNVRNYSANSTFVWYKGDREIQRSTTNSSYLATEAGTYFVQVIDGACSAVSERVVLNTASGYIITPPVVVTYPQEPASGNKIVCGEEGVVVMKITTTYSAGTYYQWYKDGLPIAGATGIIYSATEAGFYYVEVNNNECAAVSEPIQVIKASSSYIAKPEVTLDPEDGRIVEGLMAVMTLENISDYTTPYYYWFRGDYNRFESTAAIVAEGDHLTVHTTNVAGDYRLLVVEGTCASWSDLKRITEEMCPIPDPDVHIVYNITGICGDNGSVLLQVANRSDYTAPAYQWYKDNSPIAGQTRSTLEVLPNQDGLYQVAITDEGCTKVSVPAISVTTVPQATIKPLVERIPESGEICGINGSILLKFTNSGDFTGATYQWYKDNYPIAGATGLLYEAREAGRYRIVVKDGNCLAMSAEENILLNSGALIKRPLISKTPDQNAICTNGSILLSVTNTHDYQANALYIWYLGDREIGRGVHFTASTEGTYFVQVIEGTCSAISRKETLTISGSAIISPVVVSYPSSVNGTVCGDDGVVVFRLDNANQYMGAAYQWYKNGYVIPGENDIIYSATEAGTYHLMILMGGCAASSSPVTITKIPGTSSIPEPDVTMFPEDGEIPSGGSVSLYFNNSADYNSQAVYYWFRGSSEIVSQNVLTYSATQPGRYRLLVVDGNCARWSQEMDVTTGCEATKPQVTAVPSGSNTVCTPNGALLLQVSNRSAYSNPVYQWYNGNTSIAGAVEAALEVSSAGQYRVRVSEAGCRNYSDIQNITTVAAPSLNEPLVTRIPASGDICGTNGSVMLRFTNPDDFPGATYQWYKNNFAISGAVESLYEATQPGEYRIVVIDGSCMAMSAVQNIRLNTISDIEKPQLAKFPDRNEICINGSIRLTVTNTDRYDSPSYIWYRGTEEVQRGSLSSYVATRGGKYFVQVIDGTTCSATSAREELIMGLTSVTTPEITVYPSNNQVCANNGVVVMRLINAASYVGATYQWYGNNLPLSGETGTVLSTTEAGTYYLEVRTFDCYAVSAPIEVSRNSSCLIDPPVIAANPADAKIIGGLPVDLFLTNTASYSPSAQYYWFKDGETVVVENQTSYTTTVVGVYRLLVVDGGRAAWSNEIEVTLSICNTVAPQLSVLPQSLDICGTNGSVVMSVTNMADYTIAATWQWYKNGVAITGANRPYYNATEPGNYEIRVIDMVNGEGCLGISSSYPVTRSPLSSIEKLEIKMTPSSGNLCMEGSVILYVYNRGAYENATYQWYKDGLLIPGATANTYEITYDAQDEIQATYTAQVLVGGCGTLSEDELIVTKLGSSAIKPEITASGTTVCGQHGSVLLYFSNEEDFGSGNKFYQWFYNNELIAGATNSSYEAGLGGNYRLQVVAGLCGAFSDEVTLTGSANNIPKPQVEMAPQSGMICGDNGSVILYVTNPDVYHNPVYQWYKNDYPIANATDPSYEAFERAYYRVQISEGECTALSVSRLVNKNVSAQIAQPQVETIPAATEICGENGVIVFRLTNAGQYSNATYQWYKNNMPVAGANSVVYHAVDAGNYRIQVIEGQCGILSVPVTVTKNNNFIEKPIITTVPSGGMICGQNGTVLISVSNSSVYRNARYVWYYGTEIVQDGPQAHYEASDAGIYYVQVVEGECSSVSLPVTLQSSAAEMELPLIVSVSGGTGVCGENGVVVLRLTNASDYTNATYQWFKNSVPVTSATGTVFHATEPGDYRIQVMEASCAALSQAVTVTRDNGFIEIPVLAKNPASGLICGTHGSVLLSVINADNYNQPLYVWYRGAEIVQNDSRFYYEADLEGEYYVQVIEGSCSSVSAKENLRTSAASIAEPVIASVSGGTVICGENGVVVLRLTNEADFTDATYQWYKDNRAIASATEPVYHALEAGNYRLLVTEEDCGAFSTSVTVTRDNSFIEKPLLSLSPASGEIGMGGSVLLTVTNHAQYTNPVYVWYLGTDIVQRGNSFTYDAVVAGRYYVQVMEDNCSSVSDPEYLTYSGVVIEVPVITSIPSSNTICGENGVVVLRLTNASDYSNPSYQWYKDNMAIINAHDPVYHAVMAGEYKLQVMDQGGAAFSAGITITKDNSFIEKPVLAKSPAGGYICGENGSVLLTVTNAAQYSSATYVWYKGFDVVQNGSFAHYEAMEEGIYYVQVVEGGCSSISDAENIRSSGSTIGQPVIASVSGGTHICGENGVVVLRLTNEEDFTGAVYQWYKNNVAIASATDLVYHATEAGDYRLLVTEGNCGAFSASVHLTQDNSVIEIPLLSKSPSTGVISDGGSVLLTVTNHHIYLNARYIWYHGTSIVQDGSSYVYEATVEGTYYVQVVEGTCSAVSAVENLTSSSIVLAEPQISSLPNSNHICGENGVVVLQLTNAADYNSPLYQWYKDNVPLTGAHHSVYRAVSAGNYRLQVTDLGVAVFSRSITITRDESYIEQPVLSMHPAGGTLCGDNGSVWFTVTNAGHYTNPVYVWYHGTDIVQNSSLAHYEATETGDYYVQVIEGNCSSLSETKTVIHSGSVVAEPVIASVSGSTEICGDNGVIVLQLTNADDFTQATYQWYKDNVAIPSATSMTYHATLAGEYRIRVTENECGAFSTPISLSKNTGFIDIPILTMSPAGGYICGENGSVLLSVVNTPAYTNATYIWYYGDSVVQNSRSAHFEATQAGEYYVQVVNGECTSVSTPEMLRHSSVSIHLPVISSVSGGTAVCGENGTVVLRLMNAGDYSDATYQWYKDNVAITSATDIVYHATEEGEYRIQVTEEDCGALSESVSITYDNGFIEIPLLTMDHFSGSLCGEFSSLLLTVTNADAYTNPTYIWYRNTEIVQNSGLYLYEATEEGDYYVQVIEGSCSSVSVPQSVQVSPSTIALPIISSIPSSNTICGENGVVVIRLDNTGDYEDATYQWYKDNLPIVSATGIVYHATEAGDYRIRVLEGDCRAFSEVMTITRNNAFIEKPIVSLSPSTGVISEGGSVLMTVTNHHLYQNAVFIWYRGTEIIQNGTSFTYNATLEGTYYVQVVEGSCSSVSDPEYLSSSPVVVAVPEIISVPSGNHICGENGVVIMRVANTYDYTNPVYQWYRNSVAIPMATGILYRAVEAGDYQLQVIDRGAAALSPVITITKDNSYIERPLVSKIPSSGYICGENGSVLLTVTNHSSYTDPRYIWYSGDQVVQDSNLISYEALMAGDYYVQVLEGECSSVSNTEYIRNSSTQINEPFVVSTPNSNTICGENGVVVLRFTNRADYPNGTYQWYRNGTAIPGATDIIYHAFEEGVYRIHVLEDHCGAFSAPVEIIRSSFDIPEPIVDKTPSSGYICGEFGSVLLTVTNHEVYENPVFIWFRGNEIVQNSAHPSYETTIEADYYVQVMDGSCSAVSDTHRVVLSTAHIDEPVVVSVPSGNVICGENGAVVLTLSNPEDYPGATYQWFKDDMPIARATTTVYNAMEPGYYKIQVNDNVCAAFSVPVEITRDDNSFIPKPVLEISPATAFICGENGSVILTLTNHVEFTNATYIWYHGSDIVQNGYLHTYEATEPGDYYIHVVEGDCSAISAIVRVRSSSYYIHEPVVTSTPSGNNICGTNGVVMLRLTNSAGYSNPTYQWYRNNVAVPGANSSIYPATAAGHYMIQVIEDQCAATSSGIQVTRDAGFIEKPLLSMNPSTGIICNNNGSVNLTVTNSSDYTGATYIWYRGTDIVQNGTLSAYEATRAGDYFVQVVEGDCSSISETKTLIANPNPLPTATIYGDTTMAMGGTATITLHLTGTPPWNVVLNDRNITAYATPFRFPITPSRDTTISLIEVTDANGCPNAANGSVTVHLYASASASIAQYEAVVCAGTMATMSFHLTGTAPWELVYHDGTNFHTVPNITNPTHTITLSPAQTTTYTLISVSDAHTNNVPLNSQATITVNPVPIVANVTNFTYCHDETANAHLFACNLPGTSFRWEQLSGANCGLPASQGNDSIPGFRAVNNGSTSIQGTYQVTAYYTNGGITCESTPQNFTIRVNPLPNVTLNSVYTVCADEPTVPVTYTRAQNSPMNYNLVFSAQALQAGFQNITVATQMPDSRIDIDMPENIRPGTYTAQLIVSLGGCEKEFPFTITILPVVRITEQPVSQNAICENMDIDLSVTAEGHNLTYQWFFDGAAIPGATSSRYFDVYDPDKEGEYYVEVTGTCGGTVSSNVVSVQGRYFVIERKWDDVLFVSNRNEMYDRYQWFVDGMEIRRNGNSQYYSNPEGLNGIYTVRAYYANGTYDESCPIEIKTSKALKVSVYPNPVAQHGQLIILIENYQEDYIDAKVELYDMVGQIIFGGEIHEAMTKVPVEMASGTYVVRITTGDGQVFVHKVIVK